MYEKVPDKVDLILAGMIGCAVGAFTAFAIYASGAFDNRETWTMSDIKAELRERYDLPQEPEPERDEIRKLLEALPD